MAKHEIRGWPPEEDARLRVLWEEGHSSAEIGRRMGRTKNSVVGRVHRLGLPSRPSPLTSAPVRRNSAQAVRRAWAKQKPNQTGAARAPVRSGRQVMIPGPAARVIPATAGDPGRSGPAGMAYSGHATGRSAIFTLPPAEARPGPGVFSGKDEGCRWPMWGDQERPTQRFCCAPRWVRDDGTKAPYCDRHAARAFARVIVAEPVVITRRTFAWGGRAA